MMGYIHSIQTLGAVDGPGLRFVVFLQGCNLRCGCCHNPDTWQIGIGKQVSAETLIDMALRYKPYFGKNGGITVTGGEPLLQSEFVYELFKLAKQNDINTCLDTSGSILTAAVRKVLSVTDLVLLDVKYTDSDQYLKYVGCPLNCVLGFLQYLNTVHISVIIRQVIIPTLNDTYINLKALAGLQNKFNVIQRIELLPFKKSCLFKYDAMGIDFKFKNFEEASETIIEDCTLQLNKMLL